MIKVPTAIKLLGDYVARFHLIPQVIKMWGECLECPWAIKIIYVLNELSKGLSQVLDIPPIRPIPFFLLFSSSFQFFADLFLI